MVNGNRAPPGPNCAKVRNFGQWAVGIRQYAGGGEGEMVNGECIQRLAAGGVRAVGLSWARWRRWLNRCLARQSLRIGGACDVTALFTTGCGDLLRGRRG